MKTPDRTAIDTGRTRAPDQETILRVAAELFERRGYSATTMQHLADELRIAKPTLYVHGRSKAAILEGIIDAFLVRADELLTAALEDQRDPRWIRVLLSSWMRHSLAMRPHQHAYDVDRHHLAKEVDARYRRWAKQTDKRIRDAIRRNQEAGTLRSDVDAGLVALTLLALSNWTSRWFSEVGPLSTDEVIEGYWRVLWQGLAPADE